MLDYRQKTVQQNITPQESLEKDGWTILEGNPKHAMRFDHGTPDNAPVVAIWECTPGKIHKDEQRFNEFATILEGEVEVTVNGESQLLQAGDTFFVAKGDSFTLDIKTNLRKCFIGCGSGPLF